MHCLEARCGQTGPKHELSPDSTVQFSCCVVGAVNIVPGAYGKSQMGFNIIE